MPEKRLHKGKRTCLACKKRHLKKELLRFILTKNACKVVPQGVYEDGRSYYVCPASSCLKKFERIVKYKMNGFTSDFSLEKVLQNALYAYEKRIEQLVGTSYGNETATNKIQELSYFKVKLEKLLSNN